MKITSIITQVTNERKKFEKFDFEKFLSIC